MTSLEEERREVWRSLLEAAGRPSADPNRAAACRHLLGHMIEMAIPPWRRWRGGRRVRSPEAQEGARGAAERNEGEHGNG